MRIAFLTEYYPTPETPGSGAYVRARAQGYRVEGHEVAVFQGRRNGGPERADDGEITVWRGEAGFIEEGLGSFGPDVLALHTPYFGTPHTEAAFHHGCPVILWVHGYEALRTRHHAYHQGWRRWSSLLHDRKKLRALRGMVEGAAGVVFVSRWLQETATRNLGIPGSLGRVIPNPVDMVRFHPPDPKSRTPGPPRGLLLRTLRFQYGIDVAVQGLAGVGGTGLTIVGSGPMEGPVRELITRTRAPVELRTESLHPDEVPALLREFDYFLAPSRTETQGLTMCEAMATGHPVVASSVGGIPEFVRDGVDGFLVPPDNPGALGAAVQRLVGSPETLVEMGRRAREGMEELCGVRNTLHRELALLTEVGG